MLYNIKIFAGQHTEIAAQGSHLNVIVAAGEITARLRDKSGSTFETKLISGMAFELPKGFVSAAFTSDSSQQLKVWLSHLPMNFTPTDSRIVGTAAVVSSGGVADYMLPKRIANEYIGRRSVTFQPERDLFIGGHDVTPQTAIKILAGESFRMDTQSAVYGYSVEPSDKIIQLPRMSVPFSITSSAYDSWSNHPLNAKMESMVMLDNANYAIAVFYNGGAYLVDFVTKSLSQIDWSFDGQGGNTLDKDGNYVFISGSYGYGRIDRAGAFIDKVSSFIPTTNGTAKVIACNPIDNTLFLTVGTNSDAFCYVGKMGETPVLKTLNLPWNAYAAVGTSTGRVLFFSKAGYCYTDDNGATFSPQKVIGGGGIVYKGTRVVTKVTYDELNGYIYIVAGSTLQRSTNNGETFEQIYQNGSSISTISVKGSVIVVKEDQTTSLRSNIYISVDSGVTFNTQAISTNAENVSYDYKAVVGITALGVAISSSRCLELLEGSGEPVLVGGMPIGLMEELN